MTPFQMPTPEEFLGESTNFLPVCEAFCTCANGWHFVWSAFKASGQRRAIYSQQPMLGRLLAPMIPAVRKVLIAGAADAGILSVLASLLDARTGYLAVDVCQAPLQAMREYAQRNGLALRCQQDSLADFQPEETFDLVFVHNTFYFLQPDEVRRALRRLRTALHPGARMVCGMRYEQSPPENSLPDPARYAANIRQMIQTTYAALPQFVRLIEPHVDDYAASYCAGSWYQYQPDAFEAMLEAAGYRVEDRFVDGVTPALKVHQSSAKPVVVSEILLLSAAPDWQR